MYPTTHLAVRCRVFMFSYRDAALHKSRFCIENYLSGFLILLSFALIASKSSFVIVGPPSPIRPIIPAIRAIVKPPIILNSRLEWWDVCCGNCKTKGRSCLCRRFFPVKVGIEISAQTHINILWVTSALHYDICTL